MSYSQMLEAIMAACVERLSLPVPLARQLNAA
jgi:hypothetical protein